MEQAWWVVIAVAFVGGQGFGKMVDIFKDWRTGRAASRRAEVDHMATLLAEAEARVTVAERRSRIATELMHETRVVALSLGAKSADLPPVDFKDD